VIVVELTITRLSLARLPESSIAPRVAIVLITCAATIAAVMMMHAAAVGSEFAAITFIEITAAVVGSVLITGSYSQQQAITAELSEAESQLNSQINNLRRTAERIRHRIAQLLHGTIQGRLALASLRLTELRTVTDPGVAAHSRAEILALLASIEAEFHAVENDSAIAPAITHTLDDKLAIIARDWAGLLHFTSTVHPDASRVLRTRPRLAREVGDIINEAVINARRHGDATTVTAAVTVATESPLALSVTVKDDGNGPTASTHHGLGLAMLASLGARWALLRDEHQHTVLVVILQASTEMTPSLPKRTMMTNRSLSVSSAVETDDETTHSMERIERQRVQ